jgi:myosin-5
MPDSLVKWFFQENQDSLLQCVIQDVGFNNDRPIAACILYKSLLQWRSFEAERTNVFDRIIQTIGTAIEVSPVPKTLPH